MTELPITHRTRVTDDQIDHLGHMNVRFYGVAARAATQTVVAHLDGAGDLGVDVVDVYTRHFREQLLGAELSVRSGLLQVGAGWVRVYHELVNDETGDLAASFVHRVEARAGGDLASAWPPVRDRVTIDIPERGRPRSIDLSLDLQAATPTVAWLEASGLQMRHPRLLPAEDCGPDGVLAPNDAAMLLWGGEPIEGTTGPALHPGPDGQLIGWAAMENRMRLLRMPRAGDRIQSFAAVLAVHDKTTHRLMWAFDLDRGELLVTFEVVDLAFDTVSRRAVSLPDDLRAPSLARLHPELAPR